LVRGGLALPRFAPRACGHTLCRYFQRACSLTFRQKTAFVFEIDHLAHQQHDQEEIGLPEGYTFRQADLADLPGCAEMAGVSLPEYQRRWRHGDECYVVVRGGRPVNLSWLHFGSCYVCGLGLLVEAPQCECYLYNVFTDRAHRGRGLYKVTQRLLKRILALRGTTRIRQVVTVHNAVPLATLPRLGYRLTQIVRYRCILGLNMTASYDAADGRRLSQRRFWKRPAAMFWI